METIYYVSPEGNDRQDGLRPVAEAGSGPFATPARARDAIRAARQARSDGSFAVEIRGGFYFLDKTFNLGVEDSGVAGDPVVYRAYAGEQPVLSGGVKLDGFEETEVNGLAGWVVDVPAGLHSSQLFVNGQRMARPRMPRQGFFRMDSCEGFEHGELDWYKKIASFAYKEGDLDPDWRNLEDTTVMAFKRWFDLHLPIASIAPDSRTVTLRASVTDGGRDCDGQFLRYYVDNVFEGMRQEGQFYLDRSAGKLYFLPRYGDKVHSAVVIAPRLEQVMALQGDPFGAKVEHVRFENLTFAHTEYRYEDGYAGSVQAAHTLPGAVTLRGAQDCVFYGCSVTQVAQYGIEFRLGCTRNQVLACHLHDLGGGGIKINSDHGTASQVHEPAVALRTEPQFGLVVPDGQDATQLPRQKVTVSDCRIHDGGKIYQSAVGIWIGDSAGNRIRHNEIRNMHYSGISCGWMWLFNYEVEAADNIIEYNHVHHLNPTGLLSDLAGLYTLGPQPGSINRYNLLHDIDTAVYGNWGLYNDGSSSLFDNIGNVAYHCGYGGYFSNVGKNNRLIRNIFVNDASADNPAAVIGDDSGLLAMTATENLFCSHSAQVYLNQAGTCHYHARFNANIMCDPIGRRGYAGRDFEGKMVDEAQWVAEGVGHEDRQITYSIRGDENGNLCIPDDAPFMDDAWRAMLAEVEKAGPRYRNLVPAKYADWPQEPAEPLRMVVMPVFELEIPMLDETRGMYPAELYLAELHLLAGRATQGALRLRNRGEIPAKGRIKLYFENVSDGTVTQEESIMDLGVGEETRLPFAVRLNSGVKKALLYAAVEGGPEAFFPVGIFLYAP